MKVSIIMCSYNISKYLKGAIDSILNQTYTDWELIIADDCSTDNSLEIIKPYLSDPRIKLYQQEKNVGYVKNKNFGLSKGTGQLLTQLDADDLCPPDRIEKQANVFINNPEIMACGTNFRLIGVNDEFLDNIHEFNEYRQNYVEDFLVKEPTLKYPFWFPGLMFRKELLDEIGYFPEYFDGIYGDDHYWCFKVNQKYPIYMQKDNLYYYRINPDSLTNVYDKPRKLIAQDIIAELHRQIIETGTDDIEQGRFDKLREFEESLYQNKKLMGERYQIWAAKAIDKKNWEQAKDLLKKHFSYQKTNIAGYKTLLYYLRAKYLN